MHLGLVRRAPAAFRNLSLRLVSLILTMTLPLCRLPRHLERFIMPASYQINTGYAGEILHVIISPPVSQSPVTSYKLQVSWVRASVVHGANVCPAGATMTLPLGVEAGKVEQTK